MSNTSFNIIFAVLSFSYLALMGLGDYPLHYVHKALPIITLLAWAWCSLSSSPSSRQLRNIVIGALFFSALGDVFLALPLAHSFVLGLSAFLTAHVFYIICFWQMKKATHNDQTTDKQFSTAPSGASLRKIILSLTLIYFVGILWLVMPNTGALLVPVVVYMGVILMMAIMAISVPVPQLKSPQINYGLVAGALTFVLSDSVIAINKFVTPVPFEGLIIMVSYYLAQWLLVTSINRHAKLNVSDS